MGGQNNWPQDITAADVMTGMQKRILHSERAPIVRQASDLLGPGVAAKAVRLLDWNDDATAFNGFFYTEPGAQNSPNGNRYWMGLTEANGDGYGFQRVVEYRAQADPNVAPDEFIRTFATAAGTLRTYSDWHAPHSGGLRNVGVQILAANVGPSAAVLNIGSVTLPFPVLNRRYRATLMCNVQNDTAGAFSEVALRHGLSATTGGTVFADQILDHRLANRRGGVTVIAEFTYAGVSGATPYNVVGTVSPGSNNVTAIASATVPIMLTVDEIMP